MVLAAGTAYGSPLLEGAVRPPPGGASTSTSSGGAQYTTPLSDVSTAFTTFQAGKPPSLGHHRSVSARPPAPGSSFAGCSTGFFFVWLFFNRTRGQITIPGPMLRRWCNP